MPALRTWLALLALATTSPALADTDTDTDTDIDTDTDTDTDEVDTDPADTDDAATGPTYAAHDLAGDHGGSACLDGGVAGALILPWVLGLGVFRRN